MKVTELLRGYVTVAKYAKDNNVSRQAVHNWIKEKKVESLFIEGRYFVKTD